MVNKKYLAWAALAIYSLLIFIGSSIPGDRVRLDEHGIDKLLHAGEYLIHSLLLFISLRFIPKIGRSAVFWLAAAGSSLYGLSDEIHQMFVPLREFDLLDILSDTSGAIVGSYLMFRASNNGRRRPFKP